MSYEVGRTVFTARSLGTAQAVRSAAHIGPGMSAPANGEVVNDIDLADFAHLVVYADVTMAYTGGATDPTLTLRLQRKIKLDLADDVDAAWEDVAAFEAIPATTSTPTAVALGLALAAAADTADGSWDVNRDALAADAVKLGPVPKELRLRETVSGGDRTGGALTYTVYFVGRHGGPTGG